MADTERSRLAETYGSNNRIVAVFPFMIAMPGYTILTGPVKIQKDSRKNDACFTFHLLFNISESGSYRSGVLRAADYAEVALL